MLIHAGCYEKTKPPGIESDKFEKPKKLKKIDFTLGNKLRKTLYLHPRLQQDRRGVNGLVAQLNSASDYGSEGYRFESCRGHIKQKPIAEAMGFFIP